MQSCMTYIFNLFYFHVNVYIAFYMARDIFKFVIFHCLAFVKGAEAFDIRAQFELHLARNPQELNLLYLCFFLSCSNGFRELVHCVTICISNRNTSTAIDDSNQKPVRSRELHTQINAFSNSISLRDCRSFYSNASAYHSAS